VDLAKMSMPERKTYDILSSKRGHQQVLSWENREDQLARSEQLRDLLCLSHWPSFAFLRSSPAALSY
jgi:hypothetical protein